MSNTHLCSAADARALPSIVGITPFERPDARLVAALCRAGALGVLDLGRDEAIARSALDRLARDLPASPWGVRIPEGVSWDPAALPPGARTVVLVAGAAVAPFRGRTVLVQVTSVAEARAAVEAGASGLIVKGNESGGRVGSETTFVLLQRLAGLVDRPIDVPLWAQGGAGLHTAAACIAGGAAGVVLDAQLALVRESTLPDPVKNAIRSMDGSETTVLAGHRLYTRPDLPIARLAALSEADVIARLGGFDLARDLVPAGQDAAFARPLAERFRTAGGVVHALRTAVDEHLAEARRASPLAAGSVFTRENGIRYPILQGPMTRVSDRAAFALAVAEAGGLPFLALALSRGDEIRALLEETRVLLGDRPWGVGILGFVPEAIREEQLAVLRELPPPAAIIAGGRPSQARPLDAQGTRTFLHVPSPGLLDLFLRDGARRFVFEGRECGGHVGPRSSFALWEPAIERLLAEGAPETLSVVFAGGIHDARSAAMVAAMAAPLAARGVRIGVLMGTAYLFTEEAVSTGAILPGFQRAAIGCEATVLLETAPGHSTRCVETGYVRAFIAEKRRLEAEGKTPEAVWEALEHLNLGRLRIAAKGIRRDGAALVRVDDATQEREGMFMIGQVGALRAARTTMADLHREVSEGSASLLAPAPAGETKPTPADVAIVGIACIFPDAPDRHTFWANILSGKNSITEVPRTRWNPDLYFDPASTSGDKTPSRWGGFLPPVAFDPLSFGIPPKSLAAIEPVQLLSLEVARRALADAGYADRPFDRARTSVIFGAEAGTELSSAYGFRALYPSLAGPLPPHLDAHLPRLTEDSFPGVLANVIAGRIANRLDLGGVNYTVDAACAASLAAVDLAVKELTSGTSDMVLAGGADVHNSVVDYLLFASVHALSPTGACRTFDAEADGIALGEGVACVVLKRLADAERDGDRIYAVIKGIAGSSDGRSLGLTAPRREGQMRALDRAYEASGVSPAEVGLVEAHGTGTVVGDRTELGTLTEVYRRAGARTLGTVLGSVKSQIGHTKCAAGMAGIIKAALALHHRALPPTLNLRRPNPAYDPADSPFAFTDVARPWPTEDRRAAVSAFGFGGTNFHAVLAAHDAEAPTSGVEIWPAELFLFRGPDRTAAVAQIDRLSALLDADAASPFAGQGPGRKLGDLARTVSERRGPVQIAMVATSIADLRDKLGAWEARAREKRDVFVARAGGHGKVAFLMSGQGSQRVGMLGELFVAFPRLGRILALGEKWASRIYPPLAITPEARAAQAAALMDTRVAQPALGIVALALGELLHTLGVRPDMLAGHSWGELAALCLAGAFGERELLELSEARGVEILAAAGPEPGTMAAVTASAAKVAPLLEGLDRVVLANLNAPDQTVISGPKAGIETAMARCEAAGLAVRGIPVAAAFHGPLVAGARDAIARRLARVQIAPLRVPVYSNATAAPYPTEPDAVRAKLAEHVGLPVRFADDIEAMYAAGARTFVEVGPGRVLTGLVGRTLGDRPHLAIACDKSGEHGLVQILRALAELCAAGVPVDPAPLFAGREARAFDLDRPPSVDPPASAWMVDGHLARPLDGELPPGALRPAIDLPPAPPPAGDREAAVLEYLRSTREIIEAQKQVMLGFLGSVPTAPADAPPATLEPATLPMIPSLRPGRPAGRPSAPPAAARAPSIPPAARLPSIPPGGRAPSRAPSAAPPAARRTSVAPPPAVAPRAARLPAESSTWLDALGAEAPPPPSTASIQDTLLSVVSERTGYPIEMLDLDLNLEAELSIDSIKRIEILGTLGREIGFMDDLGEERDKVIEQLATRKTLRGIVDWLEGRKNGGAATTRSISDTARTVSAPAPAPANGAAHLSTGLRRYEMAVEDAPTDTIVTEGIAGHAWAIAPDAAGIAPALAAVLEARGARVHVVGPDDVLDQIHGLVHLAGFEADDPATATKDLFERARLAIAAGAMSIVAVTRAGAPFAPEGPRPRPGVAGLLRSLAKEVPGLVVRAVGLDPAEPASKLAEQLALEIATIDDRVEVAHVGGARRALRVVAAPSDAAVRREHPVLALGPESVVLVTGGARGITALAALALAKRHRCRFELCGRSPLPDRPEDADLAGALDAASLRKALLARGAPTSVGAIEAMCGEILAARAVRATLAGLEAAGALARYHAVDVRDRAALGALIDGVYARHGRLDGVIHGAGVLDDKLHAHKTRASFDRVFDTKVAGAQAIAAHVRPDIGFVAFFASVSGAFGNRGQVDYAAANDALDKLAWWLSGRIRGRVVALDWGPWAGTGMVSPELARVYERAGVGLVDPAEGAEGFAVEIGLAGAPPQVILMNAAPEAFAHRPAGRAEPRMPADLGAVIDG